MSGILRLLNVSETNLSPSYSCISCLLHLDDFLCGLKTHVDITCPRLSPGAAGGAPSGPGAGGGLDPGVQTHGGGGQAGAGGVSGDHQPTAAALRIRPQALQPLGAGGGGGERPAHRLQAQDR